MTRRVQLLLLCEDSQHEAFARRFLEKAGWTKRELRVVKAPRGRGSAARFIQQRFPVELKTYRRRRARMACGLFVMVDGDRLGTAGRQRELDAACDAQGVPVLASGEHVAVFVPTWNIESWLAYLDGQDIDEARSDYPRLTRAGDCQRHVDLLWEMCQRQSLRSPAPPSLVAACDTYRKRVPPHR